MRGGRGAWEGPWLGLWGLPACPRALQVAGSGLFVLAPEPVTIWACRASDQLYGAPELTACFLQTQGGSRWAGERGDNEVPVSPIQGQWTCHGSSRGHQAWGQPWALQSEPFLQDPGGAGIRRCPGRGPAEALGSSPTCRPEAGDGLDDLSRMRPSPCTPVSGAAGGGVASRRSRPALALGPGSGAPAPQLCFCCAQLTCPAWVPARWARGRLSRAVSRAAQMQPRAAGGRLTWECGRSASGGSLPACDPAWGSSGASICSRAQSRRPARRVRKVHSAAPPAPSL